MNISLAAAPNPFDWNNLVLLGLAMLAAWNAYRSQERDKKVAAVVEVAKESKAKVEEIDKKADVLHALTDGNLSRTTAALELAVGENKNLRELISTMAEAKKVADTLAMQVTTAAPAPAGPVVTPAPMNPETGNVPAVETVTVLAKPPGKA